MKQFRILMALRTATFGMLSFLMAQLAAMALLLVAFYAFRGDLAAIPFLPIGMVSLFLAILAMRELASGLRTR